MANDKSLQWKITAESTSELTVSFAIPVSEDEAVFLFRTGAYDEILDEQDWEINTILGATQHDDSTDSSS
jgi:hypothetical protein